jgi:hypothetical protein
VARTVFYLGYLEGNAVKNVHLLAEVPIHVNVFVHRGEDAVTVSLGVLKTKFFRACGDQARKGKEGRSEFRDEGSIHFTLRFLMKLSEKIRKKPGFCGKGRVRGKPL